MKNGSIQFGNSEEISWKEIDRWNKNESKPIFELTLQSGNEVNSTNPRYLLSPPNYTLFTFFTLGQYFIGFCIMFILHTMFVFMTKWKFSQSFMELNLFEKLIHSFENMNIPFNCEEWDSCQGDAETHRNRMNANSREIMAVMLVNFVFNCIMISPLTILGNISIQITILFCSYFFETSNFLVF